MAYFNRADGVSSALGYGALVVVPLYGRTGRAGGLAGEGDSVVCCCKLSAAEERGG